MIKDLILENERKIDAFDVKEYLKQKQYPIASALSALETTNEVQKCYFEQEDGEANFNVMKLYAFLQSLFVSIDSLYALSYSLTKSKSFININKNPILRELKYIRNDVVGHPATRVLNSDTLAFCILDNHTVQKDQFIYHIYSNAGVEEKKIDVMNLVKAYYNESNHFLVQLYEVAKEDWNSESLLPYCRSVVDAFDMNGDYMEKLQEFKQRYLELYPKASSYQHRVLWRLELIDQLLEFQSKDANIVELKEYCIGLEIIKIYQLLSNQDCSVELQKRNPYLVSSFYRFLNKNQNLVHLAIGIYDSRNPLISNSFSELLKIASKKNVKGVVEYLRFLKKLYENGEDALLYAFALPIKAYKQK